MNDQPQEEHRWLEKLVGEWTYAFEGAMEPGGPPVTIEGRETVRTLGGLWYLAESDGDTPTVMTLGYDPEQRAYVGTFIGAMMTKLWIYRGHVDAEDRLILETSGPSFNADGETMEYREIIEFQGPDRRSFTSTGRDTDGAWKQVMRIEYRRV